GRATGGGSALAGERSTGARVTAFLERLHTAAYAGVDRFGGVRCVGAAVALDERVAVGVCGGFVAPSVGADGRPGERRSRAKARIYTGLYRRDQTSHPAIGRTDPVSAGEDSGVLSFRGGARRGGGPAPAGGRVAGAAARVAAEGRRLADHPGTAL